MPLNETSPSIVPLLRIPQWELLAPHLHTIRGTTENKLIDESRNGPR